MAVLDSRAGADDRGEGTMNMGRLARESQVLVAAAALVTVGLLRDQVSVLVLIAAVAWSLYVGWNSVTAAARER